MTDLHGFTHRKNLIFNDFPQLLRFMMRFGIAFGSILDPLWHIYSCFLAIDFSILFYCIFINVWSKLAPQGLQNARDGHHLSDPKALTKPILRRNLDIRFWMELGSHFGTCLKNVAFFFAGFCQRRALKRPTSIQNTRATPPAPGGRKSWGAAVPLRVQNGHYLHFRLIRGRFYNAFALDVSRMVSNILFYESAYRLCIRDFPHMWFLPR